MVGPPTPGAAPAEPSKDHLERLQRYRDHVLDPQARPDERRNWAEVLLDEAIQVRSAQSLDLVVELLSQSHNAEIRSAACEAIATLARRRPKGLPASLIPPLIDLLGSGSTALRGAAARALAGFPGHDVPKDLASIVAQPDFPAHKRQAAIDALAPNVHRREVVAQLINLLDVDETDIVERVVAALQPASSEPIGSDPDRWRRWWLERSQLGEDAWLAEQLGIYRARVRSLLAELEAQQARAGREQTALGTRVADFQREVFLAQTADQREAKLVEWLNDTQEDIKLTALIIIKGRIADEGKRPQGAVLTALLRLLEHELSTVRREVLSIVQSLGDPRVAEGVLARFDKESDPETRKAFIRAIGRLGSLEAVPPLIDQIAAADATAEMIREAAIALGQIAGRVGRGESLRQSVTPLKQRYGAAAENDVALRAGLLEAMAGVADPSFASEFVNALESSEATILRPAIEGLRAIDDASQLPRLRRLTAAVDPLVRLAAIEAVGALGREDADLESLAARLNPQEESDDVVREAAWHAFCGLAGNRSAQEGLLAADMLRAVPDQEMKYLSELVDTLTATNGADRGLELVRERLCNLLMLNGQFGEAVPHLRELYAARHSRGEPEALDTGLRLLDATLRAGVYTNIADLLRKLAATTDGHSARSQVVDTIAQFLDSPEIVGDPARAKAAVTELRAAVPPDLLGEAWLRLIQRVEERF